MKIYLDVTPRNDKAGLFDIWPKTMRYCWP